MKMWEAKQYAKIVVYFVVAVTWMCAATWFARVWPPFGWLCVVYTIILVVKAVGTWLVRKFRDARRAGIDDMEDCEDFIDEWEPGDDEAYCIDPVE